MVHQLEVLASGFDMWTIMKWLRARCSSDDHLSYYKQAVKRIIASAGADIVLVGCLLRDTEPAEADLKPRGKALSKVLPAAMSAQLYSWYLELAMDDWPTLVEGGTDG
jgi:hypothetical protein